MKNGCRKDGYELRINPNAENGIYAVRPFKKNEIVMVGKIGKVLTKNQPHASQMGENEYVLHAGLINMVNHSCEPNCGIKINETGAHDFVAMRDIHVNEEITYDFAMSNYEIDFFHEKCICGSEKCRTEITGWKNLSTQKKEEYKGFVAPYLLALDKKYAEKVMA